MSFLNEIKQHLESLQKREGSLAAAIQGLDAVLAAHRAALSPQLQHYLSQRSYDKALAWVSAELAVQGEVNKDSVFTPPPGGCSGRRERN